MTSIALYCDREHTRLEIGRMMHHDSLGEHWTLEHPSVGYRRDLVKMNQVIDDTNSPVDVVFDDVPRDAVLTRRFRLACRECGLIVVARGESGLWTCLDRLAECDVAELRLAELAAALRYSAEH